MTFPLSATTRHARLPKAKADQWYSLRTNAKAKHADIYLYGVIGGWRANVNAFLDDLRSAGEVTSITVYLNTIGGTFYDGLPIYNTLKQHKAHVTVKVMGYALSMGSVIMLAADDVQAAENAIIMIHGAQGFAWGDARHMRHEAEVLETHENAILPEYCRRMGKSAQDVQALLEKETWYTAAKAKAAGLVNTITDAVDLDKAEEQLPEDSWEFAANHFQSPPDEFAARFQAHWEDAQRKNKPWIERVINLVTGNPAPVLTENKDSEQDEDDMKPEDITALAEAFGNKLAEANKPVLEKLDALHAQNQPLPT